MSMLSYCCKRNRIHRILFVYFFTFFLYSLQAGEAANTISFKPIKPLQIACGELNITVDPRIELLTIIQYLSGSSMVKPDRYGYADSISAWFAPYKTHPVFERFQRLEKRGFSYDLAVMFFLQYESVPLTSKGNRSLPDYNHIVEKRMNYVARPKEYTLFVAELNDFVKQSRYDQFYQSQSGFYTAQMEKADSLLSGARIVETMVSWYGYRHNSYSFVISPLQGGSGYGPAVYTQAGKPDVYCITAMSDKTDDGAKADMAGMLYHEFGHSYINPLVVANYPTLKKASKLAKPIQKMMANQAYQGWWVIAVEHIVRASTLRLLQTNSVLKGVPQTTDSELSRGFIYIDFIYDNLVKYEVEHRKTGITLKNYFLFLAEDIVSFSRQPQSKRKLPLFRGPINAVSRLSPYIIIPDPENNPDVNDYIVPVAKFIAKRTGARILTDTKALGMKFTKNNLYVYGTPQNNQWLSKHLSSLPFQVLPDRIIADKTYTGTNLRIISCLPNPDNPQYGMAIYTAQSMEAIKQINNVFHGPEDYIITDSASNILGKGDYDKTGSEWKFKAAVTEESN